MLLDLIAKGIAYVTGR